MTDVERNKQVVRDFIQTVWVGGDLSALQRFWTEDCVNHAAPEPGDRGMDALRTYHEGFKTAFVAFSDIRTEVMQQVAEGDKVVTQIMTQGVHDGPFLDVPATGRRVSLLAIRIDRLHDGRIVEHWSVSDLAGLMQQLQA